MLQVDPQAIPLPGSCWLAVGAGAEDWARGVGWVQDKGDRFHSLVALLLHYDQLTATVVA